MRAWELYEQEQINELKVAYQGNVNDKSFEILVHRGNVWIFDGEDYEDIDLIKNITAKIGIDVRFYDLDGLIDYIQERPDIIYGRVQNNEDFYLDSYGTTKQSPYTSKVIRDIVKHFNLQSVSQLDMDSEDEITIPRYKIVGKITDEMYHGTNNKYISNIFKKGIMPTSYGNWKNIKFPDLIFVAASSDYVRYHAIRQATEFESIPVIVKIKIPDKNKLLLDYDVATLLYGIDHPEVVYAGYDIISPDYFNKNQDVSDLIQSVNKGTNLNTQMGIFAYRGRIPANHITEILFPNGTEETLGGDVGNINDWLSFTDKNEALEALDMIYSIGFYDPDYEDDWDEDEDL